MSVAAGAHVAKKPRTDPASGRTITQGGGTTSGIHTLKDGPPGGGSRPSKEACTDVNELNKAKEFHIFHPDGTKENKLSDDLGRYLLNNGLDIDETWVKGHLQNDNLGGKGDSTNLTPADLDSEQEHVEKIRGATQNGGGRDPGMA
ncbi:hypothetical protein JOF56_009275 [Kibdelosporangium banguiense]|uniref:Uncharacterized protein n=1 Tax=Kibdelosporangium banguiense TaxID=1365924 RepID=A0ABS4TWU9_9PSEU|nr:hypothetical protein [Kibdelosporangium banguiense]MBP2328890.1 hypothetical protein [Kibdelosporangium banguiense]